MRADNAKKLVSKKPFRAALVSEQAWFLPEGERPRVIRMATYQEWEDHYSLSVEEGYRVVQVQEVAG